MGGGTLRAWASSRAGPARAAPRPLSSFLRPHPSFLRRQEWGDLQRLVPAAASRRPRRAAAAAGVRSQGVRRLPPRFLPAQE